MKIRLLAEQDSQVWKQLRLEALQNAPESFASSYEEEVNYFDDHWKTSLQKSDIFGAFIDDVLIATAGFYRLITLKTKHRGVLFGMYTTPKHCGKCIASHLIEAVINHAKSQVVQIHLACVTTNMPAIKLYQKHNFKIYGTEPSALKIGDAFFNEHLMVLDISGDPHAK